MYVHRCSQYCSYEEMPIWFSHMRCLHKSRNRLCPFARVSCTHPFFPCIGCYNVIPDSSCFITSHDSAAQCRGAGAYGMRAQHATAAEQGPRPPHGEPERCRCSTSSWQRRFGWSPHHLAVICPGAGFISKHQMHHEANKLSRPNLCRLTLCAQQGFDYQILWLSCLTMTSFLHS